MSSAAELVPSHPHPLADARRRSARPIGRIDRSGVFRLVLAVAAVALALVAQGYLERRLYLGDAALLILVAGLVFARAARGTVPPAADAEPVPLPTPANRTAFLPGAVVLALGVALNAIGLVLFGTSKEPTNGAWLLYAGSIPTALTGVYLLDARPSLRNVLRRNRRALALLGLVLVAAGLMRFYRLGEIPFGLWSDESMSGLEILRILREPGYRPVAGAGPVQGLPAMAWYVSAPVVALLGPTELALRIPAATAGLAGVVAIFLLGRALFGTRFGLVAAGILATMAWHVTFSRVAFHGVYSTALNTLSLAFLVFALRTGRRSLFALSGLALGLSVNFYFAARLFLVVAGLFLLHHLLIERTAWLRRHFAGLLLFGLFGVMAAGPLALMALQNPRLFNERSETVSVFREVERENSYQPIVENVRRHLLMFNVQGDSNGRHNLPGAPMLERTTAALAVVGLVLALTRASRPEYLVLVVWLLVMMQTGVLTLSFEAPQSYRTVDNTVATALLAALPIASIGQRLAGLVGQGRARLAAWSVPTRQLAFGGVAAVALLAIGVSNVDRYFVRQARDSAVWAAHATPETIIGREIAAGKTVGKPYVDQTLMDHPSIRLLAPQSFPNTRFDPASSLPFRDPEGATVFLGGEATAQVATVKRLYPDATVVEHRNPAGGPVVLHEVLVPPDAIARVQGADIAYWSGVDTRAEPSKRGRAEGIGLPATEGAPAYPHVAEWRAVLAAPAYGRYAFKLEAPKEAVLKIDETELTTGGGEAGVTLARGNHTLSLRAPLTGPDAVHLLWRTPSDAQYAPLPRHFLFTEPVTNNGLLGSYYHGTSWAGEPGLQQIDPSMQLRFHLLPLPRPYSVEWRGKIFIPDAGAYRFGASAIDESWIYLDERMVVDNSSNVGSYGEGGMVLSAGFHDIRIRYVDRTGHTYINVFWTPPGRVREPLPTELLFPPQGSYPDKVVPPPAAQPQPPAPSQAPGAAQPAQPAAKPAAKPVAGRPGPASGAPALPSRTLLKVGLPGDGDGQFDQPRAAAIARDGSIYVADTVNHRIQKFDPNGQHLLSWGGAEELQEPLGIAVDSAGRILVLDSLPGWIKRYTPDGELVEQFGGPEARFYHPRGLAIDAADNLYVADTGGGRVVKFNGKGEQVAVIGQRGTGPGQIMEPTGAIADAFGNVWVADAANAKLVRYDPNGSADVELSLPRSGSLHGPHVAVAAAGDVYVTDPEGGRVYLIGSDGATRGVIEAEELRRPVGIGVGPDGRIAVADVTLHHVVVLSPPERSP
jgi:DNA-binding beta-propeller fold protein YncE/4-amino-4-deoxy-L-arabinose transferase-like glycosyltransferase